MPFGFISKDCTRNAHKFQDIGHRTYDIGLEKDTGKQRVGFVKIRRL